jgi:pimeloyl-ACP methyl ester carboxylesterase
VACFADHIPPHVTVAMYRTNLVREALPILRGRYADAVLDVPATLMVGAGDIITRGLETGPVAGQPNLRVEVLEGVAHWVPEQRPQAVIDWVRSG